MVHNIDVVHSLYNGLLGPWLAIAGVSEVSVRLPSAVAVAVAGAGVFVLIRRLVGFPAAVAAGLVFAVLPRVTWSGMEGRSYAATAAVAVWLTFLFVAILRTRPGSRIWPKLLGYAVLGGFAISLNIFVVLLLGAHGLVTLLDRRLRFRRVFFAWLGSAIAALICGLPVLLTAMSQSAQIGPTRLNAIGYLRSILVNQWFLGGTPTIFLPGGTLIDPPGMNLWKVASVALAVVSWLIILRAVLRPLPTASAEPPSYRVLLLSWLAVPTVILVGYAVLATPIYNPRYLTYATPAVAGLIGIGIVSLGRLWLRVLAAVLIVVLAFPVYYSQRTSFAKSGADWKEIASFVAERRGASQGVYYAPRTPPTAAEVGITSRTAQTIYPAAFDGLRDLTLISTPAEQADLVGRSRLLENSVDKLHGLQSVFVVRRSDYAAAAVRADEAVLARAGFAPVDEWIGPLNTVVEFSRR